MVGAEPAHTLQWTWSVGKEVKREKYVQLEATGDVQRQQCGEMISARVGHIPLRVTEERLELLVRSKNQISMSRSQTTSHNQDG
jgi:hypothetical protein